MLGVTLPVVEGVDVFEESDHLRVSSLKCVVSLKICQYTKLAVEKKLPAPFMTGEGLLAMPPKLVAKVNSWIWQKYCMII